MKRELDKTNLLYVSNRQEWRSWLRKNYKSEREIWLVYPKKHVGKPRIPYNDAVEEALCFGWIDSTVRSLGSNEFAQRFSRRKPGSPYSQSNKERLRALIRKKMVVRIVLESLGDLSDEKFEVSKDILRAIKENETAWANFQRLPQSYIRIRVAFIDGARNRPHEFKKRLRYFVRMTEKNKQFGFGGIEKYF